MRQVIALVAFCLLLEFVTPATLPLYVGTNSGPLEGFRGQTSEGKAFRGFYGIPFAKAPVGNLRFRSPERHDGWVFTRPAKTFQNWCVQVLPSFQRKHNMTLSEDCLYLNIFTPVDAEEGQKFDVFVYIHGGAYVGGGSSQFPADELTVRENAIYVTIQYRLNVFGFFANDYTNSIGASNAGLQDQILALRWVEENIHYFNGDPDSTIIFGESAGGSSVMLHMLFQQTKFNGVIAESPGPWYLVPYDVMMDQADALSTLHLCFGSPQNQFECLQKVDPMSLQDDVGLWAPTVGTWLLPEQPLKTFMKGDYSRVPLIIGTNKDEGNIFLYEIAFKITPKQGMNYIEYNSLIDSTFGTIYGVADKVKQWYKPLMTGTTNTDYWINFADIFGDYAIACGAHLVANVIAENQLSPVYRYHFTRTPPSPIAFLNATHASELPYVFHRTSVDRVTTVTFAEADEKLSTTMNSLWRSLSTGVPKTDGVVWEQYSAAERNVLQLDSKVTMQTLDALRFDVCENWTPLFRDSHL